MYTDYLKQSYRELLMTTGVSPQKAEEASEAVTYDDLKVISDIWPDWNLVFLHQVSYSRRDRNR
jgi:hypothetical protein